jgi:nucleoside-diphosphate-sugar epimerase
MKLLLTGSTGFLGKSIVKELVNSYDFFSLSRTSGDYIVSLESDIPYFKHKFDLVVHAAGKAHSFPRTVVEKQQFHDVNVLGTRNLLKGLDKVGLPKQFIFISSVSVYGQESGTNINEEYPLQAKDSYGLSKIEAEILVTNWCKQNNVVCTILRLPLLVGENPPGNLDAMLRAIEKGYYFNIGGGKARKSMVLVQDVTAFIPIVASVGGVYNLTDGFHPSFYELSSAISLNKNKKIPFNLPLILAKTIGYFGDLLEKKAPINSLKIKKIISNLTFDDAKARDVLNWNPQSVLEYLKRNTI